jgi:hypothetical protein
MGVTSADTRADPVVESANLESNSLWRRVWLMITGPLGRPGDPSVERRREPASWMWLVIALVLFVAGVAGSVTLAGHPKGCPRLQTGAQFAGTARRFDAYAGACDLSSSTPYWVLAATWASTGAIAWAAGVTLYHWWPAWPSWTVKARKPLAVGLPLVMATCALITTVLIGLAIADADGGPPASPILLAVIPTFAWPWLVSGVLLVVLVIVLSVLHVQTRRWNRRAGRASPRCVRERPRDDDEGDEAADVVFGSEPIGLGIACSGGGIRAGTVALGALSVLERTGVDGRRLDGADSNRSAFHRSVLRNARFVSSVSGGGYTGGAWFAATGAPNWYGGSSHPPLPVIQVRPDDAAAHGYQPEGDELDVCYDDNKLGIPDGHSLFRHIEAREQYLRTGRGGLLGGGLLAVGSLLVHLAVVLLVVVLVAWPTGRLTRSWYIFGGIDRPTATVPTNGDPLYDDETTCVAIDDPPPLGTITRARCFADDEGRQHNPTWAHLLPVLVFGGAAAAVTLASCMCGRTQRRRVIRSVAAGLAAIALMSGVVVLAGPWLLDVVYPQLKTLPKGWAFVTGASFTGIALVVYKATVAAVKPRLIRFSGYLVAVFAVLAGIYVAGNAATAEGLFGFESRPVSTWLGEQVSGWERYGSVVVYAVVAAVIGGFLLLLDPKWWSLHAIYRARLRNAFATRPVNAKNPDGTVVPALRKTGDGGLGERPYRHTRQTSGYRERDLYEFLPESLPDDWPRSSHPGPLHLICTTAARRTRFGTGIRGEPVVFSPDDVRLYESGKDATRVTVYRANTRVYLATLHDRVRGESMLDAISGAAVAPSMGRMHRGSAGTAFALANLRLGVWFPNPRWFDPRAETPPQPLFRYPRTGLAYLFKEFAGLWSTTDRYLYLTDGGHWDNLGLVELVRRRCKTIICIDASGDRPGSFASLRNAVSLAKIQCRATITGLPDVTPDGGVPTTETCWKLTVTYHGETPGDCEYQGTIIYLLAGVRPDSPAHLVAFSAEDDVFPNYSTGNQFLSQRRFRHLFAIGRDLVEHALGHTRDCARAETFRQAVADALAVPPDAAGQATAARVDVASESAEAPLAVREWEDVEDVECVVDDLSPHHPSPEPVARERAGSP